MRVRVVVSCAVLFCLLAAPAFGLGVAEPVTGFFSYVFGLFSYADEAPQVTDAFLNQYKFVPGDHMMITVHVVDDYGVDEVRVEIEHDTGVDVVNMILVTGNEKEGTYQEQWVVHDCSAREYDARIVAVDSSGQEGYKVLVWEDPLVCNPGHMAEDVCPGEFGGNATGAGLKEYSFPGDLGVNGDLDVANDLTISGALTGIRPTGAYCSNNQVLKYNFATNNWICADDDSGTPVCTRRVSAGCANTVSCQVGEILMGGGCDCQGCGLGRDLYRNYPQDLTTWHCHCAGNVGGRANVYAICCRF